jgi:hypothetical protein
MKPVTLCPNCGYAGPIPFQDCPDCGIVVEKYLQMRQPAAGYHPPLRPVVSLPENSETGWVTDRLFDLPGETGRAGVVVRGAFLAFLGLWGLSLVLSPPASNQAGSSFLHLINLPFHEAGHVIFSPLGKFVASLGGTLGQLLIPLLCAVVLVWKNEDAFGGAVGLWWLGENFVDIAPYINDARAGTLPLLGGNTGRTAPYGFHDWEYLLNETGLLRYDQAIARASHWLGALLMILAMIWGGVVLYRRYTLLTALEAD